MDKKVYFSPSLMCMNLLELKQQVEILNERADFYHVDIMDGHYVKNITLSPMFVEAIKKITDVPIDCHLMTTNPDDFIEPLAAAGADYICPHAETINAEAFRIINKIKALGCKFGIVLNPATPMSYIQHYIHHVDKLTIMSVDPGFAGQPFVREMLDKAREAARLKEEHGYHYIIEIDGSCNERTYKEINDAGIECFIVGSSGLFNLDEDLVKAWDKMAAHFEKATGIKVGKK